MTRQAIFTLRNGDIKVWFPDVIQETEMEYVEAYFDLLLKGMRQRAEEVQAAVEAEAVNPSPSPL